MPDGGAVLVIGWSSGGHRMVIKDRSEHAAEAQYIQARRYNHRHMALEVGETSLC